jgi:hypothetical protein
MALDGPRCPYHIILSYPTLNSLLRFTAIDYKNMIYLPKEALAFLGYIQCIIKNKTKKTAEPGGSARLFAWVVPTVVHLLAYFPTPPLGYYAKTHAGLLPPPSLCPTHRR